MNTYDVKCPVCGVVNHSLFLEETDGWMECEHCGHTAKYCWEPQTKKQIPVFVIRNLQARRSYLQIAYTHVDKKGVK